MSEPQQVEILRIPSTLEELPSVDSAVERIAADMGFEESARADLGICVTEAASNAIVHAHRQQAALIVEIRFERFADRLRVQVRDHGAGFDPAIVPDPTLPENLLKVSGRGLHLIRALMDEVTVSRRSDGMEIVMIKKLAGRS
jgi:serine/threonine-protein kinase RsbW